MIFHLLQILLTGLFFIFLIPKHQSFLIRFVGMFFSFFSFFFSLFFWIFFDDSISKLQFVEEITWISFLNIHFFFGIDCISLFFILLSTFLIPLCLFSSWSTIFVHVKEFFILFFILEIFLLLAFSVSDLFLFYVFFESLLIPTYFLIGIWGSRERKLRASFLFFIYTLFGSVFMFLGIIYLFLFFGSTNLEILFFNSFEILEEKIVWLSFFIAFGSKIPMFPIHFWLPEAHVEAPTSGSVILAGILLKLGSYGFLKFLVCLFPNASFFFTPLIFTISILGIVYASFTAIRQTDLKRIIAYSSVAHMNLIVMGIFCFNSTGLAGAIFQSLSHGFVSSAFFLLIGILYDRFHSRILFYYTGLVHTMPLFVFVFFILTLANIAMPLTSSFVGEFLILAGIIKISISAVFFSSLNIILSCIYSLWLFNRIAYGNLKLQYFDFNGGDITKREFFILLPFLVNIFFFGFYPEICLGSLYFGIINIVEIANV